MITISFISSEKYELEQFPEQWREYVSIQAMAGSRWQINIGIQPDDSSYCYRALMQFRQMILKFSLPFFFEFPVGSWITYQGFKYYINRPEDIKKQGLRKIEYSITMYGEESELGNYKFRNTVDGRLKWSMCAKPHEFIEEICRNLNERTNTDKWTAGSCLESTEKTVEFNHTYLVDALNDIANTFETEWEIDASTFTINLRKVEKFKNEPLPLGYGRGNGFVPGVGRVSEVGGEPVKRLYVQGGERNIDRSKYGEKFKYSNKPAELRLPKNGVVEHEGRQYQSDAEGYYIERIDKISDAVKDDSLDCSEIYPSRIGDVTMVPEMSDADKEKNFYDFVDDTIPANFDLNSYLIAGESMTIIFQSGMLAGDGKEFEVKYFHNSVNGKAARRFEIVPQEIDGITMPNETFKPEKGNKYAIFGIMLPDEYICDDVNKAGAAWNMMREAARKLYECEDQKFTFSGELQGKWAKRNWENIGAKITVGGYVLFTDNQFAPGGVAIRIVGIKDYLTNPYQPTIELSNAIASKSNSVNSSLAEIDNVEVVIDDTKRDILRFTKRRFRDALETIGMLEDAQLAGFTGAITPVAIQTMAALVGDESLQFIMGKTIGGLGSDDWGINVDGNTLTAPSGYLRHMTIGVDNITSERANSDFLTWKMPEMNLTAKDGEKYYLYAVVRRSSFATDTSTGAKVCLYVGTWELSKNSHALYENANYYYLLVGVLNSEYLGERSFATMYGFTEILPGQITTDVVKSGSGESYFDLKLNRFKLGNKLEFNIDQKGVLRLRGAMVQSPSGSETPLPSWRGTYSSTTTYYIGDLVSLTTTDGTSNYICINAPDSGIRGISPVNSQNATTYWQLYTRGSQGSPGSAGKDAPILVFRGNWDSTALYFGNSNRVDCVKYGSEYYVAKTNATEGQTGFRGQLPTDSEYWRSFGSSFESVATSLLLAEKATIGNWFISGDNIVSTHGTVNGAESDDFTNPNFRPDVVLDGGTGELVLYSDKYPRVRISNQSVATLFNESLVNEANISRVGSKSIGQHYVPVGGSTYESKCNVGLLATYTIGQMNPGSIIKINGSASFYVPNHRDVPSATVTGRLNGTQMRIVVKRNGVAVTTFTGASGAQDTNTGGIVSHQMSGSGFSYNVPEDGAGNYTLEFYIDTISFYSSSSGYLNSFTLNYNLNGSYVHGGFNRTVIGNDGIGSFWNKAAMVFSANGFQIKCGTMGFKVDSSGIHKTTNWTTDSPRWEDI